MLFGWRKKARKPKPLLEGVTKHLIAVAYAAVREYGAWLEQQPNGLAICDETVLPSPKETLLNSLIIVVASLKDDDPMREICAACARMLSQFQKDVDAEPLLPGGVTISQFDLVISNVDKVTVSDEELLLSMLVGNPDRKVRYEHFLPLVASDRKRIGDLMVKAIAHDWC